MLPVILLDSGMIILQLGSEIALLKHSSKVLQGNISASGKTDSAARCEYAPKAP